jgi:hypothetical protein
MPSKLLKVVKPRNKDRPLLQDEVTNRIGEKYLEKSMALLLWRQESNPGNKDKDHEGVDYIYSFGHTRIGIQLKSANLDLKHRNWTWHIADSYEELDGFYDEIGTFLFLVGVKIFFEGGRFKETREGSFQEKEKGQKLEYKYELPQIALIPGQSIMKFFEKSKGKLDLHISPRKLRLGKYDKSRPGKYNNWNDYLGEDNIHRIMLSESQIQEKEYAQQKENRSNSVK